MADLDWLADEPVEIPDPNQDPFAPLPKGWYELTIERVEIRENKAKTGRYVKVGCVTNSNRWVWTNYNIEHESKDAQRIGRQEFAQLCVACGFRGIVRDSSALLQRQFSGYLVIDDWGNEPENKVQRAKPIEGANAGPVMAQDIPAGWG